MTKKALPSPETLRKVLRYVHTSGKLFWRERGVAMFKDGVNTADHTCRSWNARWSGKEAFTADNNGYYTGGVFGTLHLAHRVIWAMVHDEWPAEGIDHINHDKGDNRIANLRSASVQENGRNMSMPCTNTSGHVGVYWPNREKKWHAQIKVDGRNIHLGQFDSKADAITARNDANTKYGFHENHGSGMRLR